MGGNCVCLPCASSSIEWTSGNCNAMVCKNSGYKLGKSEKSRPLAQSSRWLVSTFSQPPSIRLALLMFLHVTKPINGLAAGFRSPSGSDKLWERPLNQLSESLQPPRMDSEGRTKFQLRFPRESGELKGERFADGKERTFFVRRHFAPPRPEADQLAS